MSASRHCYVRYLRRFQGVHHGGWTRLYPHDYTHDCNDQKVPIRRITLTTGLVALTAALVAACGSQPRFNSGYDLRSRCETCGNIERIERVRLRDQQMDIGAGAVLGAIIGGVAGSQINSGDHEKAAIAAGALAGGVIGHQIQRSNQKQTKGYQFDLRLDDGRWAQVTQLEKNGLRVGDRVIIRVHQLAYLR